MEFLDLMQGSMSMFNHLAQCVGIHIDTDEKKRDHFYHDLSCSL